MKLLSYVQDNNFNIQTIKIQFMSIKVVNVHCILICRISDDDKEDAMMVLMLITLYLRCIRNIMWVNNITVSKRVCFRS